MWTRKAALFLTSGISLVLIGMMIANFQLMILGLMFIAFLAINSWVSGHGNLEVVRTLSADNLYKAIYQLEQIDILMDKILSYAHLLVSEDGNNEKNKIFYQQMQETITNYASSIIFFTLELNEISEKKN